MRRRLHYFLLALAVACTGALTGCDSASTSETSTFRVLLTDAPGDFLRAVVTIDQVYLQAEEGDDDPEEGRTILSDDPVTVDLLTLQNEVLDLVDGVGVPSGTYHQLRLVISGGYVEVEGEDGGSTVYASSDAYAAAQGIEAEGRLQMPSYAQSGLKIVLPGDAAEIEGEQHVVLLDFYVAESFGQQAGGSGAWVMSPVVRATDFAVTGGAEVSLSLADGASLPDGVTLAAFSASLDKGGDVLTIPFVDADGDGAFTAAFRYLAPGTYPVDLVAPDGLTVETDAPMPLDVTTPSGGTADAAVVITSATD